MFYTLTGALKATGLNKTMIMRAIESGKITGTKDLFGECRSSVRSFTEYIPLLQSVAPEAIRRSQTRHPMQRPSNRRSEPSSEKRGIVSDNSPMTCAAIVTRSATRHKPRNGSPIGVSGVRGGAASLAIAQRIGS
jgi:hypothetical protein